MKTPANPSSPQPVRSLSVVTADGVFLAHYSAKGLCGLDFPARPGHRLKIAEMPEVPQQIRAWHRLTSEALTCVLAGRKPERLPPLDFTRGTEFQQSVWQALSGIALGKTLSYGQVAAAIGRPKAVRAVGGACGANPVPVLVPCHRVLAAGLRLGGFGGGLDWKRLLLAREGIRVVQEGKQPTLRKLNPEL